MGTTASTYLTRAVLCIAAIASMAQPLRAQMDRWTLVGPFGGHVSSIAVAGDVVVTNAGRFGLFRTEDHGEHWSQIAYPFGKSGIAQLIVHDSLLFAFGSDLYRSTNRGLTWETFPGPGAHLPFVSPSVCFIGSTMYASPFGGDVYRSADNGAQWTLAGHAPGTWNTTLASHGSTLYYSADSGLYRSRDGGSTWARMLVTPTGMSVHAFAANASTIVIAFDDDRQSGLYHMYRSTDDGDTWRGASSGVGVQRIYSLVWDGRDFLACGGDQGSLYRSADGAAWSAVPGNVTERAYAVWGHGDTVYAGSRYGNTDGMYRSLDHGATWKQINQGFTSRSIGSLASFDGDLYAAPVDEDGLFRSTDDGAHWTPTTPPVPHNRLCAIAATTDAVLACTNNLLHDGGIYRTADHGASWTRVDPGLGRVAQIAVNGNLAATVAPDTSYHSMVACYSTDGGATWRRRNAQVAFDDIHTVRFIGNVLFAGTSAGVYRSFDTGATWTESNSGIRMSGTWGASVTAFGAISNVILAGVSNQMDSVSLYRSTDRGESWQAVRRGGAVVKDFTVSGGAILATTDGDGVLRSMDYGLTWRPFNTGLINRGTVPMLASNAELFVGTACGLYRLSATLGVAHENGAAESAASLVYPNPCHGSATIRYQVPDGSAASAHVNITIFDALGHEVSSVVDARQTPGTYTAALDASGLASGTYFYRVQIGAEGRWQSFVVVGE